MPVFCCSIYLASCTTTEISKPIVHILETSEEKAIRAVMDQLNEYEVQVHFTQIKRTNGAVTFRDYTFQENDSVYFYPASTVKFPIALLALEKLSGHQKLNLNTRFYVEGDTLETTFADEVIKVFAVSDNAASNRLFEFLGQDAINEGLKSRGVGPVRIAHRLSTDDADNITTKPLIIYLNDSTISTLNPTINAPLVPLTLTGIEKGEAFVNDDHLVKEPFNFSFKNFYPLRTQQEVLKRVIFPMAFKRQEQFQLGANERDLLLKALSSPPRTWGYNAQEYYDSYAKFFMFGDTRSPIPDEVKIFNKVGYAYGTLTDCAYVRDLSNNVEFLLTATILVNNNRVYNDDQYEYDSIGIPFLAALGRELYEFELKRK
ncbi:MAG: serine hydrolase [Flavobacteriaceae bacterium]